MIKQKPTVYIVDDDLFFCDSLKLVVESVGLNTQFFTRSNDFLDQFDPAHPGCLILDLRIPEISGMQLFKILKGQDVQLPTIFLTGYGTVPLAVEVMKLGAFDFLQKPIDDQFLLERVQEAILFDARNRHQQQKIKEFSMRWETLSPRERQILNGIIAGKNNKLIALDFNISHKTVEYHRTNIMRKLKADTLVELTKIALTLSSLNEPSLTFAPPLI